MDQHYVPQKYLKQFTNEDDQFFASRIKFRYRANLKLRHPRQVCYVKDFYDYEELEVTEQRRFIETNAFAYENKELEQILKTFQGKPSIIYRTNYQKLVDIFLKLKLRSISVRKFYMNVDLREYLEGALENLKKENPLLELLIDDPSRYLTELQAKIEHVRDEGRRPHNDAIIRDILGEIRPMNKAKEFLIRIEPTIYEPKYSDEYFLTSDNPGFTILMNDEVANTNYANFKEVVFPLNSQTMLGLNITKQTNPLLIERNINYVKCNTKETYKLNEGTTIMSEEYVFCEDKEYLDRFTDQFRESNPKQIK